MLRALDDLIERRIRQAQEEGQFDDLPGQGRPLALDDDALVPEEVRAAYRVLRNAGLVPPELLRRAEAGQAGPASRAGARLMLLERRGLRLSEASVAGYRSRLERFVLGDGATGGIAAEGEVESGAEGAEAR